MMGGDGLNPAPELTELHFSAICEAMNQMMGSSATSLSSMLNCKIDISPPEAELVDMAGNIDVAKASDFLDKDFVRVTFRMTIGDLVDSTIMQLYPIQFARDLYKKFSGESEERRKHHRRLHNRNHSHNRFHSHSRSRNLRRECRWGSR